MNRRGFLGALLGLVAIPAMTKVAVSQKYEVALHSEKPLRCLDATLGDRARIWLDGREVTEHTCAAVVANERGIEIDGLVCLYDLNSQGQITVRDGDLGRTWQNGRVRWEPLEA